MSCLTSDVVVVSPNTYFNFTPLLAGTAVGTLEFRCAIEPVRRYAPQVTYYQAWCDEIVAFYILVVTEAPPDFVRKEIKCMPATRPLSSEPTGDAEAISHPGPPFTLRFDKLVIAVGAYSQTFNIPGVKEHAHFLKDVKDARRIRGRLLECFEQASLPFLSDIDRRNLLNFCIVGGGPTGIEFAAELHDLIHTDVARHYPSLARLSKITVYDVAPSILGSFDLSLRQYTEKTLSREGISILTNHHVERVEKGHMIVKEKGEVPFGLLVWSTGLAPNPLVQITKQIKKDPKTQSLIANNNLNVIMEDGEPNPDIWAIGDAVRPEDGPLPATAQVANQMAKYLVKKLNALVKDQEHSQPFKFQHQGSLAYIGDWKAIYDRPSSGEKEGFLQKETGRRAWLLWRSAYFTMTLSGFLDAISLDFN
ncbi:hypothetical protein CVT26_006689 [Gymnopilus dilepis]|uniref:Uncharacterized protein n=1 Tax=Gymnopilus dilepis TaxID=231916 RepID=A0A409Y2M6_9AGAR|nr:hypothetical protein CVT26_006689 [Gymnopilus dilepis]